MTHQPVLCGFRQSSVVTNHGDSDKFCMLTTLVQHISIVLQSQILVDEVRHLLHIINFYIEFDKNLMPKNSFNLF